MKDKGLFLRWALLAVLIAIVAVIGIQTGWAARLLRSDVTPLTRTMLVIFTLATLRLGLISWRHDQRAATKTLRAIESGWFASSVCVTLGLLGTACGFYMMANRGGAATEAQQFVLQIRSAMGTALITTIAGGFCGLLLEIQCHWLGRTIEETGSEGNAP